MRMKKTPSKKKRQRSSTNLTPPEQKSKSKKHKEEEIDMDRVVMLEERVESSMKIQNEIKKAVDKLVSEESQSSKLDDVVKSVEHLSSAFDSLRQDIQSMKTDFKFVKIMKEDVSALRLQNTMLLQKMNNLEDYSRRENVTINGIPEKRGENCFVICQDLLRQCFGMGRVEIVRAHRLGNPNEQRRPIIMRFAHFEDKMRVMQSRAALRGTNVYIDDHYSNETLRQRQSMYPLLKEMKKIDPHAQLRGGQIFTKGRLYGISNAYELPINGHNTCTQTKANTTLFSGRFSHLSNLHPVQLEIENRTWSSVEQFYQFSKAIDAKQEEVAKQILITTDPVEAMSIGRRVKASAEWNQVKGPAMMKKAMLIKFKIPPMSLSLKNTGLNIGEATRSKLWGIGKTMSEDSAFESRTWTGFNQTGELLKEVKKILVLDKQVSHI